MRISDWSSDVCSSDLARTIIIVCLNFYAVGPCSHPVWGWRKSMPVKPRDGPFERRGSANNSIFQRPKQSCLKEPIFCSCCERTVHCGSLPMRRDRRRQWLISSFPMRRHNRHVVRNQETKRVQRRTSRIRARPLGTTRMRGRSHEKPSEQNSPNRVHGGDRKSTRLNSSH